MAERGLAAKDGVAVAGVALSSPDRVLWPDMGVSKRDLAAYYEAVADHALPHLADRPLSLVRCPAGAVKACFFAKHAWPNPHPAIHPVPLEEKEGPATYMAVRELAGLVALVQRGVLEIHPWGSRVEDLEHPDSLTFDLDPGEGLGWTEVVAAAKHLRAHLDGMGLTSFPKVTGGKGLHLVVPIDPVVPWDRAKAFSERVSAAFAATAPDRFTTALPKAERRGRIFLDYLRNARGSTAVAPYTPRARAGARVATPLAWDEVSPKLTPDAFTVATVPRRLATLRRNPWEGFFGLRQALPQA